jgi:hypothetical protein
MPSPFYQYGVEYSNSGNKSVDFFFGDPSGNLHGPYRMTPTPGVWTHVAFTYDGATVKGYLNGVQELSAGDVASLQARGNSLRLGVDGTYQQFFDGSLDDLRIYSRALTASEVQSAMQTPVGAGPVGVRDLAAVRGDVVLSAGEPNPFRSVTQISFTLPAAMDAELRIVDVSGRLVRVLAKGTLPAGRHTAEWNGANAASHAVASGRYFVLLRAGGVERTGCVVRLR